MTAFVAERFDGEVRTYDRAELGERWTFAAGEPGRVIERLTDETTETLGDATDRIFKGFDTGLADFYRMRKVAENGETVTVRSPLSDGSVEIEAELLVPLLKGKDIEPYAPEYRNRLLFFPYRTHETGHRLLDEAEIAASYPNAYRYLTAHESTLRARQDGAYDDDEWYRYTNPRNLHRYRTPKLCSPYNSFFPAFVNDDGGFFFTTGFSGGYGTVPSESDDDFRGALTAILNSTLAQFFVERTSTPMRGNYFSYEKRFIEDVPLPLVAFSTDVEDEGEAGRRGGPDGRIGRRGRNGFSGTPRFGGVVVAGR